MPEDGKRTAEVQLTCFFRPLASALRLPSRIPEDGKRTAEARLTCFFRPLSSALRLPSVSRHECSAGKRFEIAGLANFRIDVGDQLGMIS